MSRLTLDRLGKTYAGAPAVSDVSLDVEQGEMIVLLGPSGCGKTTTLRMIAGFTAASSGDIRLDGTSILALPPHRREMGIVFQSYALFPHLSVAHNVAFGLEMRGVPAEARRDRVLQMLRLARLEPYADRLPRQLSGGQQQRVALARALAIEPRVLLLDEPLSNLDASLRGEVGRDIRMLQRSTNLTTVMVTHDQDEAMAMADRLVVMRDGRVQQIGTQADLYERPATAFVAGFIGRSTMLPIDIDADGTANCDGAPLHLAGQYATAGAATLALRPERLSLDTATGAGSVSGHVELAAYLGAIREHVVRIGPEQRVIVRDGTAGGGWLYPEGTAVTLQWQPDAERLFDAAGAAIPTHNTAPTTIRMNADG